MTVYIDSNIFIYPVVNPADDARAVACRKILLKIVNRELVAVTSFLTWDEFVYVLRKHLGREIAVSEGNKFLLFPYLTFLKVDERVISAAQSLLSSYDLQPRDAIHVASALLHDIHEVVSDDSDFDVVKDVKRIGLEKFH